ncbi:MAG: alpha/beta fold hydrolase [Myxococcales bacterium]
MLLEDGPVDAHARLLLAHGAGAPMDSEFMAVLAQSLAARGVRVVRFEFPYMARARTGEKRGAPDRMPVLERTFAEVLATLGPPHEWIIGGKSMGGRVATRVADALGVRGVVAYGYPFHPPKKPAQTRTEHLEHLRTPCLVVQGTRDQLGSREDVAGYTLSMGIALEWLEDGDHSFEPRKSSGRTFSQNLAQAIDATLSFAERLAP